VTDIIQSECEALGDFYTAFNGSGWTNKSNWMGTGDVTQQTACDWYGVTCAPSTGDAPQTVTKLCMGHSSNPTAACNL